MRQAPSDPRLVSLSSAVYRAMITFYPEQFKRDFSSHMAQVFRDCCRRAYREGGVLALVALWTRTGLDYLKTLIEEYARGGTNMTREKFIKLSGWALIIGSVAIFVGWLAESRPQYNQFNAASLPVDRYANLAAAPLIAMGLVLVSLGMLGLLARYGAQSGGLCNFALGLGALSGLVSAVGAIGLVTNDGDLNWWMFIMGWGVQYLMLALFGVVCLRQKLLPRWNGLPLLAGIWLPAFIVISGIYESMTGTWVEPPDFVFPALFMIGVVGFTGLGYLLISDAPPAQPTAGAV